MKQFIICLLLIGFSFSSYAQLNMTYRSKVDYNQTLSDIWGYAAPDGREYAIVGLRNGVNIVDVTDPENPVDLGTAPGPSSTWRDMKNWEHHAYITNETGDGILVIDMSNFPTPMTSNDYYYLTPSVPGEGNISDCHNIYIDEFGFAYLVGCGPNAGGPVIFDVKTTPGQMAYAGKTPAIYAHDAYVVDNKLYTSDIYEGVFTVYDVTDKSNIAFLGDQPTEGDFTHNVWINDEHTVAFTTDEVASGPVGSYDISDPSDIKELDQFRPIETLGDGVIPHNVHVWNNWIIASYYTDGCIILDGSVPDNLIEVGNFDTFIPASTGFDGVWGAYPFLPSGTILATDIGNGLYILTPNYVRACRLQGVVTNAITNQTITGVDVSIDQSQPNMAETDFSGLYKTGIATAGVYDVTYSKIGYSSETIEVTFENGVNATQDVQLTPLGQISGMVTETIGGQGIPNANIIVVAGSSEISTYTNSNGSFNLPGVDDGNYQVYVGAWGYKLFADEVELSQGSSTSFQLSPGYEDDFAVDMGWIVTGDASTGIWTWGEPVGTDANPDFDVANDIGDKCYVTGNGGGGIGNDDVDDGTTVLSSPTMDLSDYSFPVVEFSYWWFNGGGNGGAPNDNLQIIISNSSETEIVSTIAAPTGWTDFSFNVYDYITPDENTIVTFLTSDFAGSGHLVEAAIDAFKVSDSTSSGFYPPFTANAINGCAPFSVTYSDNSDTTTAYSWTFPGGTPTTSTEASPTVLYNTPGTFSASLEATVQSGTVYTVAKDDYITVEALPFASYSYSNDNGTVIFSGNVAGADSYIWDFGDNTGSSELNPEHVYTESGIYNVVLSATNDCGTFEFETNIEVVVTSIFDPISGSTISAFPNPFANQFTFSYDLGNEKQADLLVINSQGKLMRKVSLKQANGQVQLGEDLASGVYFIGLNINGRTLQHLKMIKF